MIQCTGNAGEQAEIGSVLTAREGFEESINTVIQKCHGGMDTDVIGIGAGERDVGKNRAGRITEHRGCFGATAVNTDIQSHTENPPKKYDTCILPYPRCKSKGKIKKHSGIRDYVIPECFGARTHYE